MAQNGTFKSTAMCRHKNHDPITQDLVVSIFIEELYSFKQTTPYHHPESNTQRKELLLTTVCSMSYQK